MSLDQPIAWAAGHPWHAAVLAGLLTLVTGLAVVIVRRTTGPVLTAGIGALVCTTYSADTSWRFADHSLGMHDVDERLVMFAAGEVALLACGIMARANKRATAVEGSAGTPGVPGVLLWCITGVQVVPAFSESGFWGGIVRAAIGPVMAGLLWHLAMGLEIRVTRPQALSTGLPAQLAHEFRVRLLSYLGLAVRGLTAEQVTRRRAAARAVRLASRKRLGWWGRAALKASVARSGAATDGTQRHELLQLLAARRNATELRTLPVASPWVATALPEPYPATPLGVTGAELRRLDPLDAVLRVHAAHPSTTNAQLAALCTGYGVPVTETQVQVARRALPKAESAAALMRPDTDEPTAPEPPLPDQVEHAYPTEDPQASDATRNQVGREVAVAVPAAATRLGSTRPAVHARVPHVPNAPEHAFDFIRRRAADERAAAPTEPPTRPEVEPLPEDEPVPEQSGSPAPNGHTALLERARAVDAEHRRDHDGQPASVATLKTRLRVGQPKAQLIRDLLAAEAGSSR